MAKYTPELADRILAELAAGKTLRASCRGDGMPTQVAVLGWVRTDHEGFAARHRQARLAGYDVMADEIIDLGDEALPVTESVAKARLQVDSRKWLLSKALPKLYGDRLAVAGDANAPLAVEVDHTAADLDRRIAELLGRGNDS